MRLSVLSIALLLSACAVIPDAPSDMAGIALPEQWQVVEKNNTAYILPAHWWEVFNDDDLSALINHALENNSSLEKATYSLQQSLLQLDMATADMLPSVSASGSVGARKPLNSGNEKWSKSYSSSANVSFQLDLFGKLLKMRDVRKWLAQASAEDKQQIAIAVTTQVADLYWQLGSLNQKIALSQQNLSNSQKQLEFVHLKYKHGALAQMDVLSSEQDFRQQQNSLNSLELRATQLRHALSVLVGQMPEAPINEPKSLPEKFYIPDLKVNLPSEVLDNRPDIRASRMRLMSDMANVSVKVRDFFPSIDLGAGVSTGGSELAKILSDPVGSLSLRLALPILNVPDNILNLKVSQIQYRSDLADYRNKLYNALSEVEDAYAQYNQLNKQHALMSENLIAARKLERMREVRYENGADDLDKLLSARKNTRTIEQNMIDTELSLYQNFLARYTALGGSDVLDKQ
ncbi:MAG: TolC family protein [Neisseriaceae bacterium]|nr:TolC family protein [Neisseriaceae bacterium]